MLGGTLGGLGGMGGGAIGGAGSLGGSMGGIGRIPSTATDTVGRTSSSGRVDKSVNRRNGHVSASGSGSSDAAIANTTSVAGRSIGGSGAGSASGSGAANAQLIGTDNVRSIAGQARDTARGTAGQTRDSARSATSSMQGYSDNKSASAAGTGSGSGSGMLSGGGNMLALAGSAAGSGQGAFNVMPGMNVADAKGHIIGRVSELKSTATGQVRDVVMTVGDRTATLPASNFSGSGNVLVSAMGKSDVSSAAKSQTAQ